jgi:hypothetical protein
VESPKCPNCQNYVAAYSQFCTHCGTKLAWPAQSSYYQPPQHHGGGAAIALVLIGIIAIAAVASGYLAYSTLNTISGDARSIYNYFRCLTTGSCTTTVTTSHTAAYDQQIAMVYGAGNYGYLGTNIVLLAQNDTDGFGPAYLMNGLSDAGWWYQVGVTWNWPLASGNGYSPGFHFVWEVFAPNGTTTTPLLTSFSGRVNQGDNMHLSLSFSGLNVVMNALDNSTGATASHTYSGMGATTFVGRSGSSSSQYFTGPMTEWYHGNSTYTTQGQVTYANLSVSSAWICIDEFVVANHQSLFGSCTLTSAIPQSFTFHGLTASTTSIQFTTGPS